MIHCFVGLEVTARNPVKCPCFLLCLRCHLQRIPVQCKHLFFILRWPLANVHLRLCQGQLNQQYVDLKILQVYLYR